MPTIPKNSMNANPAYNIACTSLKTDGLFVTLLIAPVNKIASDIEQIDNKIHKDKNNNCCAI